MTLFSEKVIISNRCISDLMLNLIKKSWTDSTLQVWIDLGNCLHTDPECFILLAESNQILTKIYFILILFTHMYLVAFYQKTEL